MIKLEEYIAVGGKRLRCGYTTGTCAAAAARAAAELLIGGAMVPAVRMVTPSGLEVTVEIESHDVGSDWAQCAVCKDAGDDHDVTDGILVEVLVKRSEAPGLRIDGGEGVGRVTLDGLDQPVGQAAINSVPRQMIAGQIAEVLEEVGSSIDEHGFDVIVSVPEGAAIAAKTFNPKLGIEGGISIIGTSGIVRPMSEDALISSIELEMRVRRAAGDDALLVVPGNYGLEFAHEALGLDVANAVSCSNYFGAAIDAASALGFERMLIIGHLGKMAKVAGGAMNTHSRITDCRMEVLAAHAGASGAPADCLRAILHAPTTDAALDIIEEFGVLQDTMKSMAQALLEKLNARASGSLRIEAIVFSKKRGLLADTSGESEVLS